MSSESYELYLAIDRETQEMLRKAENLLSHSIPSGDLSQVLKSVLEIAVPRLERRKFAATDKPGRCSPTTNPRAIPAHVQRAVWDRDGGRCTFVSEDGHRCESRRLVEFDHVDPVARGGQATVENLRLRCRAHNHYQAERTFGAGFMNQKREEARRARAAAREAAAACVRAAAREAAAACVRAATREEEAARARAVEAEAQARAAAERQAKDVQAGLRQLGFRADQARRAAEFSATIPDASLEARVRAALKFLCPKTRFDGRVGTTPGVPT